MLWNVVLLALLSGELLQPGGKNKLQKKTSTIWARKTQLFLQGRANLQVHDCTERHRHLLCHVVYNIYGNMYSFLIIMMVYNEK